MVLTNADRQLFQTLKERTRCLLTQAKRARKYKPASNFDSSELTTLTALCDLERSAGLLLDTEEAK